ncbi:glycosyl hydrolase family 65 protein [Streptosporangium sp. NPDC000396]|uniref:glycosyl hydrolase family 65 protein n=1 Tax=Streptosporangium sp. NPDC000396 TaxID=3366185 RepID=UPI0036C77AFA
MEPEEEGVLDRAASLIVERLVERGLIVDGVSRGPVRSRIGLLRGPSQDHAGTLSPTGISRLSGAAAGDLADAVKMAVVAAGEAGIECVKITSTDDGHIEIGLNDRSGSMRVVLTYLAERGIGAGLVLIIGDRFRPPGCVNPSDAIILIPEAVRATVVSVGSEIAWLPPNGVHLGGGSVMLLRVLDQQVRRRRHRRVPMVDDDPTWAIHETGRDPSRQRVTETLFTIGAGGLATRGSVEEFASGSVPLTLASGIYTGTGAGQHLLPGPQWTGLALRSPPEKDLRVLDLRSGVMAREETGHTPPLRTLRLVCVSRPGVVAMRAEAEIGRLHAGSPLQPSPEGQAAEGRIGDHDWARVSGGRAGIAAVAAQRMGRDYGVRTLERIAAYAADPARQPVLHDAVAALEAAERLGFDWLLAEQRAAWAARWEAVDVRIPDDPAAQLAVRFALFQLWSNVDGRDEAAVGARGLSGSAYAGHVFWDADVFVLPAVVSMHPAAAKAMITYRLHRLAAARARAVGMGCSGARFPWESAATGDDVTPVSGHLGGEAVPVLTGQMEEHITADVAWAAVHYARWSGDRGFLTGPARPLLIETARYWASRCQVDDDGKVHIGGVIGPDEYHEAVTDNAFTNVMVRWNLRQAADLAGPDCEEGRRWRVLADRLVDGYDPLSGKYEQFAGYFQLESLTMAEVAVPPVAADLLLGRERVAATQIIKQPDVLMLHHLVPEEIEAGSLKANLDFYGPRTAHGSSLSPAITACLLAQAGRADEALCLLRTALVLDLDDLTGTTATGLHMATFSGVWQALLMGFAGARVSDGTLCLDPRLPTAWGSLGLRFRCLGHRVRLDITREAVDVRIDGALQVRLGAGDPQYVAGSARLLWQDG